ncbi:hypothetical protein QBC35DRAFT_547416 [Podospora australis]|uniref:Uncharacterized protein n=1 Tax=Podospora australis TaxID=1536484 RepID=A0AAN7AJ64_9PEZI|nr:hypothetical protein QBC35DRAFT_547416 [Podospora australis]
MWPSQYRTVTPSPDLLDDRRTSLIIEEDQVWEQPSFNTQNLNAPFYQPPGDPQLPFVQEVNPWRPDPECAPSIVSVSDAPLKEPKPQRPRVVQQTIIAVLEQKAEAWSRVPRSHTPYCDSFDEEPGLLHRRQQREEAAEGIPRRDDLPMANCIAEELAELAKQVEAEEKRQDAAATLILFSRQAIIFGGNNNTSNRYSALPGNNVSEGNDTWIWSSALPSHKVATSTPRQPDYEQTYTAFGGSQMTNPRVEGQVGQQSGYYNQSFMSPAQATGKPRYEQTYGASYGGSQMTNHRVRDQVGQSPGHYNALPGNNVTGTSPSLPGHGQTCSAFGGSQREPRRVEEQAGRQLGYFHPSNYPPTGENRPLNTEANLYQQSNSHTQVPAGLYGYVEPDSYQRQNLKETSPQPSPAGPPAPPNSLQRLGQNHAGNYGVFRL